MPTSYPGGKQTFDSFDPAELLSEKHRPHHNDVADTVEAIQDKLGYGVPEDGQMLQAQAGVYVGVSRPYDVVDFNNEYGPGQAPSVDDHTKLQLACDELPTGYWLKLAGDYYIGQPLRAGSANNRNIRLRGPARILAKSDFDFSVTISDPGGQADGFGVHLIQQWNSFYYTMSRLYLEDITFHGQNLANSRGVLAALQQPGYWLKYRIENFIVGARLRGQQYEFYNGIILGNDEGMVAHDFSFAHFFGFNAERNRIASFTDLRDGSAGWKNTDFYGNHYEIGTQTPIYDTSIAYWLTNSEHVNIWGGVVNNHVDQTFLKADRFGQTRGLAYRIEGLWDVGGLNGIAIDDADRDLLLRWGDDFQRKIESFIAVYEPVPASLVDRSKIVVVGPNGRMLRYGGTHKTVPTMEFTPGTSQTAPQTRWRNASKVDASMIGPTGELEFLDGTLGTILVDRTTGTRYRLLVDNGSLAVEVA